MRQHLVARCPCCERPIWTRQLVRVLGLDPLARRFPDLGFVAQTRAEGRGWMVARALRSLTDVADAAGLEAVEQLKRLARQALKRMWFQGLLAREDVESVLATKTFRRDPDAPRPPLDVSTYVAGTRPASQAASPAGAPLSPSSKPPIQVGRFKV